MLATNVDKNETYICIRECYTYNKRFKVGDQFPMEWLQNDYFPNHHFMPADEAKHFIGGTKSNKPRAVVCAGDDPRSNIQLVEALKAFGVHDVDPKAGRQELWKRLNTLENAQAKTGDSSKRGPGRPAKE